MFRRRSRIWLLPWLALLAGEPALAAPAEYERFYGEYVGEAASGADGDNETRDIQATIGPAKRGFTIKWRMGVRTGGAEGRRIDYEMTFLPTARTGIYSAAMRLDAFGNGVPLDPIKGDPYVWARIDGPRLLLYALTISDEPGYEMQVYERALEPGGMSLKYSRVRDGRVVRTFAGKLRKVR